MFYCALVDFKKHFPKLSIKRADKDLVKAYSMLGIHPISKFKKCSVLLCGKQMIPIDTKQIISMGCLAAQLYAIHGGELSEEQRSEVHDNIKSLQIVTCNKLSIKTTLSTSSSTSIVVGESIRDEKCWVEGNTIFMSDLCLQHPSSVGRLLSSTLLGLPSHAEQMIISVMEVSLQWFKHPQTAWKMLART